MEASLEPDLRSRADLLRITEMFAEGRHHRLAFDALHALDELGEGRDTFLRFAHMADSRPRLASHSISILGRHADPAVHSTLLEIRARSEESSVRWSVMRADAAFRLANEWDTTEDLYVRVSMLLDHALGGFLVRPFGRRGPPSGSERLNPAAVWSRRELWELSREYPWEVASVLGDTYPAYRHYSDRMLGQQQRNRRALWFLYPYLSEECWRQVLDRFPSLGELTELKEHDSIDWSRREAD